MTHKPKIVFIQNSPNLAGAQKCLLRLLLSPQLNERFSLHVLMSKPGWLSRACAEAGAEFTVLPFSSSRSLAGKLWKNRAFAARAGKVIKSLLAPSQPVLIHANDHPDSLLGLSIAKTLKCPSVLTLRTPGMSRRDYFKYQCDEHTALLSVGEDLYRKVTAWHNHPRHSIVHDGIDLSEICPPAAPAAALERVVVLGSLMPRKGWHDLVDALVDLELRGVVAMPRFVFIGHLHGLDPVRELGLDRLKHCQCEFAGVAEDFQNVVGQFPFALHPSRSESFGMAAIETVAAGIPLLAGATGLIPSFIPNPGFLFEPGNVGDLADKLGALLIASPAEIGRRFDIPAAQRSIAGSYTLDRTVQGMVQLYDELLFQIQESPNP